jgi:DNA repair exonuclease SbcCD ATPase subunit
MREIEKQIDGLKNEIKQGLLTVEEKEKIIEQLRKELLDRDSKYNNLTEQFNKKQTQLKDYLNDLEKERSLKREAQKDLKQYQE